MKLFKLVLIILILPLASWVQENSGNAAIEKHLPEYPITKIFYSLNLAWWRKSGLSMFGVN